MNQFLHLDAQNESSRLAQFTSEDSAEYAAYLDELTERDNTQSESKAIMNNREQARAMELLAKAQDELREAWIAMEIWATPDIMLIIPKAGMAKLEARIKAAKKLGDEINLFTPWND